MFVLASYITTQEIDNAITPFLYFPTKLLFQNNEVHYQQGSDEPYLPTCKSIKNARLNVVVEYSTSLYPMTHILQGGYLSK